MDRYKIMFDRLEQNKEGAFVPYVTLGDPNPELSFEIMMCTGWCGFCVDWRCSG